MIWKEFGIQKLWELSGTIYVPRDREEVDRELLEHLSKVRRETKEEVMEVLKDANIFSTAFIRKWEIAKRKQFK